MCRVVVNKYQGNLTSLGDNIIEDPTLEEAKSEEKN